MDCTSQFIGMIGTVHYIEDNGDLIVYFRNSTFHINPAAATKVKEISPITCPLNSIIVKYHPCYMSSLAY